MLFFSRFFLPCFERIATSAYPYYYMGEKYKFATWLLMRLENSGIGNTVLHTIFVSRTTPLSTVKKKIFRLHSKKINQLLLVYFFVSL